MVVKLIVSSNHYTDQFESRVILDGSQTHLFLSLQTAMFESRVILDGSQTALIMDGWFREFESRVILDGSQTPVRNI